MIIISLIHCRIFGKLNGYLLNRIRHAFSIKSGTIKVMKKFDLVIVGEGISGLYAAYLAFRRFPQWNIALIADSSRLAPCSYRTTAVVSQSGIHLGVSPLGDLLFNGFQAFCEHVANDRPDGIYSGTRFHLSSDGCDAFKKRWPNGRLQQLAALKKELFVEQEETFLVDPHEYLAWLKSQMTVHFFTGLVTSVESGRVISDHLDILGDRIFLANGAYARHTPIQLKSHAPTKNYLDGSRVVPGKFALFQLCDWGEESFVLSHGHANLIYRAWSGEVLIGGTTNKNESLDDQGELQKQINFFAELVNFDLPKAVHVDTGLRHKGMQRKPALLELSTNVWALWGTYKNGWSLPHFMLKDWIEKI